MNTMTRDEMIEFLKGMDCRKKLLDEEKSRIRGSVETMQEAIYRNNFARHDDGSGVTASGFSPDKVFRVLMNSERDIEAEARDMVTTRRRSRRVSWHPVSRIGCQSKCHMVPLPGGTGICYHSIKIF